MENENEYIKIEKGNNKKNKLLTKKNFIIASILSTIFIFTILKICITTDNKKFKKSNIYFLEEEEVTFPEMELIKNNPHYHTEFLLNMNSNNSKVNLTKFENNIKKIKTKISELIKTKDENRDLYNILSTIYGAFLADSMGSGAESKSKDKSNYLLIYNKEGRFKPGQVTDDSEMAMSQAYAILETPDYRTLNEHLLYYYYALWYHSNPIDIGPVTKTALNYLNMDTVNITDEEIFTNVIKDKIRLKNSESLANGFIMRSSPFLAWFYMINKKLVQETLSNKSTELFFELYIKIYNEIAKDIQLTHPNKENVVAGSIYIFMGLCSMEHLSGKEILEKTQILLNNEYFKNELNEQEYKIKKHFENTLKEFSKENFDKDSFFDNLQEQSGLYLHSFNLTLYYLFIFDEQKEKMDLKDIYNNIIYDICNFGGDTETNAAIVGMIMGPLIGMENFDEKYFDVFLEFYSKERLIYTNTFMYLYAICLKDMERHILNDLSNNKVNYFFIKLILYMLNLDIQ